MNLTKLVAAATLSAAAIEFTIAVAASVAIAEFVIYMPVFIVASFG